MHKKKGNIYNKLDDEFDFDDELSRGDRVSRKANLRRRCRLSMKRRMDDYEEYLWKKRNGWFDDELYSGFDENSSRGIVFK